jgi:hypothetical protein
MLKDTLAADGFFIPIIVIVNCNDVVTFGFFSVDNKTDKFPFTKLSDIKVADVTLHKVVVGTVYP